MNPESGVVIEVFGEGKADVGSGEKATPPTSGVLPILVHRMCGKPAEMLVKRKPMQFLHGKGWSQKVQFAKRQAYYNGSHAAVFVIDSEGDARTWKDRKRKLENGRDRALPEFPMAIGVAHPCMESWLLADAAAIRRALELPQSPQTPDQPEELPAPCKDRENNPKRVLCKLAGSGQMELSAVEKDEIARAMNDLDLVARRCPMSFAPFADEVAKHIRPLF